MPVDKAQMMIIKEKELRTQTKLPEEMIQSMLKRYEAELDKQIAQELTNPYFSKKEASENLDNARSIYYAANKEIYLKEKAYKESIWQVQLSMKSTDDNQNENQVRAYEEFGVNLYKQELSLAESDADYKLWLLQARTEDYGDAVRFEMINDMMA